MNLSLRHYFFGSAIVWVISSGCVARNHHDKGSIQNLIASDHQLVKEVLLFKNPNNPSEICGCRPSSAENKTSVCQGELLTAQPAFITYEI